MSIDFSLTSKTRNDVYKDQTSINDVQVYKIDCSAWAEDNDDITSSSWTVKSGNPSVANIAVTNNVIQAKLTFNQRGKNLIQIVLVTASGLGKMIWLEIGVKDLQYFIDNYDYGMGS